MSNTTGDNACPILVDAAGMCIVNGKSIQRRFESAGPEETRFLDWASPKFLAGLVTLSHGGSLSTMQQTVLGLVELLVNHIHTSQAETCLSSFQAHKQGVLSSEGASSLVDSLMKNTLSALKPRDLMTLFIDEDKTTDGSVVTGDVVSTKTLKAVVNRLVSVFKGHNPLAINRIVVLQKCQQDLGDCSCHRLAKLVTQLDVPGECDPLQALIAFTMCMNHPRLNNSPGDELSTGALPSVSRLPLSGGSIVVVPLHKILLLCIDMFSQHAVEESNVPLLSSIVPEGISDANEEWVAALETRVGAMPRITQAFLALVHCYLFFSRHKAVTADHFNLFLGVTCARILYSTAEMLYCHCSNAMQEVDNGLFLSYLSAYIPITLLSAPLTIARAVNSWRNGESSISPIVSLLSSKWNMFLPTPQSLDNASIAMIAQRNELLKPSRFVNRTRGNSSSETRSIRSVECYKYYGAFKDDRSGTISNEGIGLAMRVSDGHNVVCNALHLLPVLDMADRLRPTSCLPQAKFEACVLPGALDHSSGRALGYLTGLINQHVCSTPLHVGADSDSNHPEMESVVKRVGVLLETVYFPRRYLSSDIILGATHLPHAKIMSRSNNMSVGKRYKTESAIDARSVMFFLPWQRPNISESNISALGISQIEMSLCHDPEWTDRLALTYFFLERISFAFIKNFFIVAAEGEGGEVTSLSQILGSQSVDQVHRQAAARRFLDSTIAKTKTAWMNRERERKVSADIAVSPDDILSGPSSQCSASLFSLLYNIVITTDMDPLTIAMSAKSVVGLVENMDDLLLRVLGRTMS
uniref:Wsv332-like protein n=1 Tax=Penaeus monodon endogenous nimavirus TaxID=2133795 RepID=A0A401IPG7_9VIRU|nr:MAG: wsv332-like protein [Penaeus monodon endogenous nimavirus]GBG35509.1 wsv332-like protein [Penaeus monodon endogenous nimavirus]